MTALDALPSDAGAVAPEMETRRIARAQAARFAIELQRSARRARTRRKLPVFKIPELHLKVPSISFVSLLRPLTFSFLAVVALPSFIALLYFALLATDVYEAEARFAVRTGAVSGVDALTSFAGIPSVNQVQDSLIISNFVTSRAAVEALDRHVGLRQRYSGSSIDWASRLAADASIEDLVDYWERKVSVSIESPSGIITVRVRAFSPEDALTIANGLVAESEALVNRLGERARTDLVANTERELGDIEKRLRGARDRLNALRVAEGVIDPQLTAQGINTLISELRAEAVRLEQEMSSMQRTIARDAPQIELLRVRRTSVQEQIDGLQRDLTGRRSDGRDALSGVMTRFDQLALERQVLERQYTAAAAALEQARAAAVRQQMYLAVFVRPILPEEPVGPRRVLFPLLVTLGLVVLWGIGTSAYSRWRARVD